MTDAFPTSKISTEMLDVLFDQDKFVATMEAYVVSSGQRAMASMGVFAVGSALATVQSAATHDWSWATERAGKLAAAAKDIQFDRSYTQFEIEGVDAEVDGIADKVLQAFESVEDGLADVFASMRRPDAPTIDQYALLDIPATVENTMGFPMVNLSRAVQPIAEAVAGGDADGAIRTVLTQLEMDSDDIADAILFIKDVAQYAQDISADLEDALAEENIPDEPARGASTYTPPAKPDEEGPSIRSTVTTGVVVSIIMALLVSVSLAVGLILTDDDGRAEKLGSTSVTMMSAVPAKGTS